jgi:hypothetical protein
MGGLFIAVVLAFPGGLAGIVGDYILPRLRGKRSAPAPLVAAPDQVAHTLPAAAE